MNKQHSIINTFEDRQRVWEAERPLRQADAEHLAGKYDLPCVSLLARLLDRRNRSPAALFGPDEDGVILDPEALEQFRRCYANIREQLTKMRELMGGYIRRGLPHILSAWPGRLGDVNRVFNDVLALPELPAILDSSSAALPQHLDFLGRYLVFVTDHGPVLSSSAGPTAHRQFIEDALLLTGWCYSKAQLDEACATMELHLAGARASSCGLRLTREERQEAKAWRAQRACTQQERAKP
jgi:hypothetical protein